MPRALNSLLLAAPVVALLAGCSSSGGGTSPTAVPLSADQIRSRYSAAADAYNRGESQIATQENMYCDPRSSGAALVSCQTALSKDRQTTLTYDSALRAIPFDGMAASDSARLLNDDSALENLLQQAATAPSLATISTLAQQIFPLLNTAATDATKLRSDIGLPAPT